MRLDSLALLRAVKATDGSVMAIAEYMWEFSPGDIDREIRKLLSLDLVERKDRTATLTKIGERTMRYMAIALW